MKEKGHWKTVMATRKWHAVLDRVGPVVAALQTLADSRGAGTRLATQWPKGQWANYKTRSLSHLYKTTSWTLLRRCLAETQVERERSSIKRERCAVSFSVARRQISDMQAAWIAAAWLWASCVRTRWRHSWLIVLIDSWLAILLYTKS